MAFKRLFVANRGEIALRIVRAAQALNIETVVAVSDADRKSAAGPPGNLSLCASTAQIGETRLLPSCSA